MTTTDPRYRPVSVMLVTLLAVVSACRSEPTPPPPVRSLPREAEALDIEWAGSTWIRDLNSSANGGSSPFPGYAGFHLAPDGLLFLLNIDATGGRWEVEKNRMILTLKEGSAPSAWSGTFLIHPEKEGIRLWPEDGSEGLSLKPAPPLVDLVENHWIPHQLRDGDAIFRSSKREIFLMFLPGENDMGVLGFGGVNHFQGPVEFGDGDLGIGPLAVTLKTGPGSEFETLYLGLLKRVNRYVQARKDLYFFSETTSLMAFRVRLFD